MYLRAIICAAVSRGHAKPLLSRFDANFPCVDFQKVNGLKSNKFKMRPGSTYTCQEQAPHNVPPLGDGLAIRCDLRSVSLSKGRFASGTQAVSG